MTLPFYGGIFILLFKCKRVNFPLFIDKIADFMYTKIKHIKIALQQKYGGKYGKR